jgi:hypothetical protein
MGANITVKPHVRVWTIDGKVHVTGHAEMEGFNRLGVIHLAGYKRGVENSFKLDAEVELFKKQLENELGAALKAKHPNATLHFAMPAADE